MAEAERVSRLISKSLRQPLNRDEANEVENHLEADEQSRQFTELSKVIQESVVHGVTVDAHSATQGLSADARKRMKDSLAIAKQEKASLSQAGLIRTMPVASDSSVHPLEDAKDGRREVTSEFRLIRQIGSGGLGNVWLARDERLNRKVALKELRTESLESPTAWQRFHREAEITGLLEHPNIVPIYQFGNDRTSAEPFYAMRFVGKKTMADSIIEYHDRIEAGRDKPVDLHRLLSVFLDVCQAIAYAHSRGVIHRDLKPENIALDNFGQVIVLDWGLAKLTDDGELSNQLTSDAEMSDSTMANTMQGDVIGTPLFMAPEQAAGDLENIDEQTDVYGLGAILFSILTGVAPHADTVGAGELSAVLDAIANGETPLVTAHRANVPTELAEICRVAMDRKRHLRYPGVVALSETVERWMAGQAEKTAKYESLRMEGRELRTEMQSMVWDLERNTRFMSRLPPIQKLIVVDSEQEVAEWRERLATIFTGLLEANIEYRSVTYSRVDGDQFTQLVRVERFGHDSSRIRTVPRSRLRECTANTLMKSIVAGHPDSVVSSLTCDPTCDEKACEDTISLLAGVPVFDDITEDVFGTIIVDCDIDQVLRRMIGNRSFKAHEVLVGCDTFHIMMHKLDGQIEEANLGVPIGDRTPHFQEAVLKLQSNLEYIDESCSDIYGARLWLIPNKHGIMFVMRQKPNG